MAWRKGVWGEEGRGGGTGPMKPCKKNTLFFIIVVSRAKTEEGYSPSNPASRRRMSLRMAVGAKNGAARWSDPSSRNVAHSKQIHSHTDDVHIVCDRLWLLAVSRFLDLERGGSTAGATTAIVGSPVRPASGVPSPLLRVCAIGETQTTAASESMRIQPRL